MNGAEINIYTQPVNLNDHINTEVSQIVLTEDTSVHLFTMDMGTETPIHPTTHQVLNPNAPSFLPTCTLSEGLGNIVTNAIFSQNSITIFQINDEDDPKSLLKKLRIKNRAWPIIGNFNINHLDTNFPEKNSVPCMLLTKIDNTPLCKTVNLSL